MHGAQCVTWDSTKQTQCVDNLATPMLRDMDHLTARMYTYVHMYAYNIESTLVFYM